MSNLKNDIEFFFSEDYFRIQEKGRFCASCSISSPAGHIRPRTSDIRHTKAHRGVPIPWAQVPRQGMQDDSYCFPSLPKLRRKKDTKCSSAVYVLKRAVVPVLISSRCAAYCRGESRGQVNAATFCDDDCSGRKRVSPWGQRFLTVFSLEMRMTVVLCASTMTAATVRCRQCVCVCVCVCCISLILDAWLVDVTAGVTQDFSSTFLLR